MYSLWSSRHDVLIARLATLRSPSLSFAKNLLACLGCLRRRTSSITNERSPGCSILRCCHGIAPLFIQLPCTVAHAALPQSMVLLNAQCLMRCPSHTLRQSFSRTLPMACISVRASMSYPSSLHCSLCVKESPPQFQVAIRILSPI